jgi:hypothetical protein
MEVMDDYFSLPPFSLISVSEEIVSVCELFYFE